MDITEQLEELFKQKESGALSESEFEAKKAELLAQQGSGSDQAPKTVGKIYKDYWRKSFTWRGRAARSEYWWPWLITQLVGIGLSIALNSLTFLPGFLLAFLGLAVVFFYLGNIFPSWAVMVRRFHDLGKSAWFAFVPTFAALILILIAFVSGVASGITRYANSGMGSGSLGEGKMAVLAIFIPVGFLVCLILNLVWGFVFPCFKGQPQANKYGNPRV